MMRALLTGLCLFSSLLGNAFAYQWPSGVIVKAATNGVPVLASSPVRGASVAAGAGAAELRAMQLLGIGSASASLGLSRSVALTNLAKVARVAFWTTSAPLTLLGLALTALNFVDGQWMSPDPDAPMYPDRWYRSLMAQGACRESPAACTYAAALSAAVAYHCVWNSANVGCVATGPAVLESGNPNDPSATLVLRVPVRYTWSPGPTVVDTQSTFQAGPVTAGAPGAGAAVPATEQQVEDALKAALLANPAKAGQLLDEAIKNPQAAALLQPGSQVVTGPSTVDGGTTTETRVGTAGTTTTVRNTTYNLAYSPNTVTVTSTVETTTTHPDSSTETSTQETEAPGGDPAPPEEVPDVCEENPDASGCAPFGEPDPEVDFPEEERSLSWVPSLSAAGSCPADQTATVQGQSVTLSWGPVCDLASGLRPVILAVAWLSAAAFVFGVGRSAT